MRFTALERYALTLVLGSFIDPAAEGFTLAPGEVDLFDGAMIMYRSSALPARLGMRVVPLLLLLAPLYVQGRFALLGSLPLAERAALLGAMAGSPVFAFRGMTVLMKLAASMAMFRVASVRAKTGFDRPRRPAGTLVTLAVRPLEAA